MTIKTQNFYLWKHKIVLPNDDIIVRTCFGITGSIDDRQNGYEGHVGHNIEFANIWNGPYRPIKDLEDHIKRAFYDFIVIGHRKYRYEWINEDIEYDQILNWVHWELKGRESIKQIK